jgi:peptidoglycan L-alanyl-D-glutamate endopeptidase CwlK
MGFALSNADEQKLAGIHPRLAAVIRLAASRSSMKFRVLEGMRTVERQRQLVKKGASKTMNSRHLTGHAVDIAPIDGKGQVSWDWPLYHKLAPIVKQAAKELKVPLEWGGDWKSFKDGPHWQLPFAQFPKTQAFVSDVDHAEPYTVETESAAAGKSVATAGTGAAAGAVIAGDPLGRLVEAVTSQQSDLTSGDMVRIGLALLVVGLSVWLAYRKAKS